jgi:branched-chain amino acid transport system substrate-binding protein
MRLRIPRRPAASVAVVVLALGGCSGTVGGDDTDDGAAGTQTLTIGFVSPQTGPLAAFGEADAFVVQQMTAHFAATRSRSATRRSR